MKNHTIPTKLRSGDEVIVIAGKDIGKKGTIREISKYKNKAIVTGINMVKKNTKPNPEMEILYMIRYPCRCIGTNFYTLWIVTFPDAIPPC